MGLAQVPKPAQAEQPADLRHLLVLAQHHNMKDLGRDAPLGIHLINNGDFRQIMKPGMAPFDWFWDT